MDFAEKMCLWMLKTSFDIAFKLVIFFTKVTIKYGIILIIEYLKNAIKGFVKILYNPRHAIIALPLCLISPLDAKFFVGYTFGGAEYAPIIHLIIILAPFIYFYFLGKVDIVIELEERKIKIEKPSKPKKKISEIINAPNKQNKPKDKKFKKQSKKIPDIKAVDKIETLSSSGTAGFMKRIENIRTRESVKQ
jgi:hypothetical protein